MEESLQLQLDFARDLMRSMDQLLNTHTDGVRLALNQSNMLVNVAVAIENVNTQMESTLVNSRLMTSQINSTLNQNLPGSNTLNSQDMSRQITSSVQRSQQASNRANASIEENNRAISNATSRIRSTGRDINGINSMNQAIGQSNEDLSAVPGALNEYHEGLKNFGSTVDLANDVKDVILTGGTGLLIKIPKAIIGLLSFGTNMMSSLIGAATKFYAFSLTLPFTVSALVTPIANALRSDLIEVIQAAGEEAKEAFDLTSDIGRSAAKMTNMAKGLMKEFENPKSQLAMLYGQGASGAATFLRETFKAVESMGHYGEVFGPSIMNNTKTADFVLQMQRAMGIGAQEMAYYAMDAFNSGKNPVDYLTELSTTIKKAADDNDLDFKAITKEFHKLRTNIVDFGDMTSNEIVNLTTRLRKMKVKTDDAVNVFKKFSTFEEAAKTSAMLFQSFEMNIDAFDLLTARDPAEMMQQFKDAMFQTGRSFKDLNRHEKALMVSTTGISEQTLSSLMSYMDQGMTYAQAKEKMQKNDPTVEQTKMLKGLTSTIKQVQKTLQFKSPFTAFFQGLFENVQGQQELQSAVIDLNKMYEAIRSLGSKLDLSHVEGITRPLIEILSKVQELITGGQFTKLLRKMLKTSSEFMSDLAYDLETSKAAKAYKEFGIKVKTVTEKMLDDNDQTVQRSAFTIIEEFLKTPEGIDVNLAEALPNIFKKQKTGYTLVKGLTLENIVSSLEAAARATRNSPEAQKQLMTLHKSLNDLFVQSFTGDDAETIKTNLEKTTTIKGRVNKLYDDLLDMFKSGGDMFKEFHDLAGRIMGSLIRGFVSGTVALIKVFNGGVDQAVLDLGLSTEKELSAMFPGEDPKKISILRWLGISKKDAENINNDLQLESGKMIKNIPKVFKIAGSLLSDLKDIFVSFAEGIVAFIAEPFLETYNRALPGVKTLFLSLGFNPVKAGAAITSRSVDKKEATVTHLKALGDLAIKKYGGIVFKRKDEDSGKEEEDLYIGGQTLGGTLTMLKRVKQSLVKESMAYRFLENVNPQIEYIANQDNFTSMKPMFHQRLALLYDLLASAIQYDSLIPSEFLKKHKGQDYFEHLLFSLENKYKDPNMVNQITSIDISNSLNALNKQNEEKFGLNKNKILLDKIAEYSDPEKSIKESISKIQTRYFSPINQVAISNWIQEWRRVYGNNKNQNQNTTTQNVNVSLNNQQKRQESNSNVVEAKDLFLKSNNIKIIANNQVFKLDKEDTVIAFKEGGYFTSLIKNVIDFKSSIFQTKYKNIFSKTFGNIFQNNLSYLKKLKDFFIQENNREMIFVNPLENNYITNFLSNLESKISSIVSSFTCLIEKEIKFIKTDSEEYNNLLTEKITLSILDFYDTKEDNNNVEVKSTNEVFARHKVTEEDTNMNEASGEDILEIINMFTELSDLYNKKDVKINDVEIAYN
tara:strand:+ start:20397 stop:24698 length:4302 start_codon:yes stop_codon:yes gene_type:complete